MGQKKGTCAPLRGAGWLLYFLWSFIIFHELSDTHSLVSLLFLFQPDLYSSAGLAILPTSSFLDWDSVLNIFMAFQGWYATKLYLYQDIDWLKSRPH